MSNYELDDIERLKIVHRIYVSWPPHEMVLDKIKQVHDSTEYSPRPQSLLIIGEKGLGKTTCAERYERRFPRQTELFKTEVRTVIPVFCSALPAFLTNTSKKGTISRLLKDLGDPNYEKGTSANLTEKLQRFVVDCKVELAILDEFQHFIDRASDKVLSDLADWLKDQLNILNIPFVLFGLPESRRILDENDQLKRRFKKPIVLEPFLWSKEKDKKEYRKFLAGYDKRLPFERISDLAASETAFKLYVASKGTISYVVDIVRQSAEAAIRDGAESIEAKHLAYGFDEIIGIDSRLPFNPFETDLAALEEHVVKASVAKSNKGKGRRQKAKKKRENVSDLLKKST